VIPEPRRVSVVGATGSGKTTFAARMAARLGVPAVELDALHWGPDWSVPEPEVLRQRVLEVAAGPGWVLDGNYSEVQPLVWDRAALVVWLDYSLPVMFRRLLARTVRRIVTREALWNGNRESLRTALSRDSIITWQFKTYRRLRRIYSDRFADPRWNHLRTVRLRNPREAERFLESIPGGTVRRPS
jgi:adenylate kinase family enzyme